MWAAGVVMLEMYAGSLAALPSGWGENALDLLEALVRNTPGLSSSGGGEDSGDGASSTGKDAEGRQPGVAAEVEREKSPGDGGLSGGRGAFRADMPEEVVAILREIFRREAEDRPESMEVSEVVPAVKDDFHRVLKLSYFVALARGGAVNKGVSLRSTEQASLANRKVILGCTRHT